jgi:hypothetical protein
MDNKSQTEAQSELYFFKSHYLNLRVLSFTE